MTGWLNLCKLCENTIMVTSSQLRAARAFLGWTMQEAADAAGIARRSVIRLETLAVARPSCQRLVAAYRNAGLNFERGGVEPANHAGQCQRLTFAKEKPQREQPLP